MKQRLLVSACLLGFPCRYDGRASLHPGVVALGEQYELFPVCPEIAAGLPVPRPPMELVEGRLLDEDGADYTRRMSACALRLARYAYDSGCRRAILKRNSPTCGCGRIYDGSFSKRLTSGDGLVVSALREFGIQAEQAPPVEA
ncbi:MAG: DUF523 domain-containing protein [Clostridiales bacterium]|nr:DUF523 domain-containing protein [Clostridiales bacterium]